MKQTGKILWRDLTVDNAEEIKDFYCEVVGWTFSEHPMGDYADYNIITPQDNEVLTGICHKRGGNKELPSQWLNYVAVEDLDSSLEKCTGLGGKIINGPRTMGNAKYAVIQDPAGAFLALWEEKES